MNRKNFLKTLDAKTLPGKRFIAGSTGGCRKNNNNGSPLRAPGLSFSTTVLMRGKYWNLTLEKFTAEQWDAKVKEIAEAGFRYLVLMNVAIYGKSFYAYFFAPKTRNWLVKTLWRWYLRQADKYGIRFFVSNGFFGDWRNPSLLMKDPEVNKLRMKAMNETAEKYGHHKSFYGWYYPNETGIIGHYDDFFIDYVNQSSAEAARLLPNAKTLIAPYGTQTCCF